MESDGEGGAWGIALLAAFTKCKNHETLEAFLLNNVFAGDSGIEVNPDEKDAAGFKRFIERYTEGLAIEKSAVECQSSFY
jgi:sugar (pentulose or hexulose) kinase